MMWETIIAALTSAGFVAAVSAIIQAVVGKKRMSADAARIIEEAAGSAVERSEKEILSLRARLDTTEETIASMGNRMVDMESLVREKDRRVDELEDQVVDLTEEVMLLRNYAEELRAELSGLDPSAALLIPPRKIAKHFYPTARPPKDNGKSNRAPP